MTTFNYRSKRWKRVSEDAQRQAGWRCELTSCRRDKRQLERAGLYLVTHHRLDADAYPQFAFDPDCLIVLCNECHDTIHGRKTRPQFHQMVQVDWVDEVGGGLSLQAIDDMGLFERVDRRSAAEVRAAEIAFLADDFFESRTLPEAAKRRKKQEDEGLYDDEFERPRSTGMDEDDANTTTETTRPIGGRSA